jgi:hypothetical protein
MPLCTSEEAGTSIPVLEGYWIEAFTCSQKLKIPYHGWYSVPDEKKSNRSLLFFAMVVLLIVTVIVAAMLFSGSGGDNGDGNEDNGPWKDLDSFKASISEIPYFNFYEVNNPEKLDEVDDPGRTVYLLIGLEEGVNSTELVSMGDFLDEGGHVIVADDGTNANRISDYLQGRAGGKVTFTGNRYLVDKLFSDPSDDRGYVYNLSFVKGYNLPLNNEVYDLLYHSPNGLEFGGPARTVMTTTKNLTVIDQNDNWQMDLVEDKYKPYGPVSVEFDIGTKGGRITYISTTGFFTDNVYGLYDNEVFIRGFIYNSIPQGGDVILDNSKQVNRYSPHTDVLPK